MSSLNRDISGFELLQFYLTHGFVAPKGTEPITLYNNGFVEICRRGDEDKLYNPRYIPVTQKKVPPDYLRRILLKDGFTEKQFWEWINA